MNMTSERSSLKEYFGPANDGEQVWIQTMRAELDDFGFRLGGTAGLSTQ